MNMPLRDKRFLETPLHARLNAACETMQWYGWKGYAAAQCFTTVPQEYFALRNTAGLFDLFPMTKYRIQGPGSRAFLNRLVTRDLSALKPGRVTYCVWCNDAGQVLDDGTVFCLDDNDWRLCSQERHLDWLLWSAQGFDVSIREEMHECSGLALQGPTSCRILRNAGATGVERLAPFQHDVFTCAGIPVRISRTGFTGDLGYEIWFDPAQSVALWDGLFDAGQHHGLIPIGSLALDVTRIEAGFIQAGADFVPAEQVVRPDRARSPFELGLARFVDFKKAHFNGRRALLAEQQRGSRYQLVLLDVEGHYPAKDAFIYNRARQVVGTVTSAAWSPSAKANIAIASIKVSAGKNPAGLWAEVYYRRELQWDKLHAQCRVVTGPFYDPPRRKLTPARDF